MRRTLGMLAVGTVLIAAAPAAFGGWAVITVDEVPASLEAGRPVTLGFTVRQHGREPLRDLRPTVTVGPAKARGTTVRAVADARPGHYTATLTAHDTGAAIITVDARWHEARIALLPVHVGAPGTAAPDVAGADRGRQLFVGKGCVTCHAKRDDREVYAQHVVDIGPELTGRTWPAEWLAAKLANPAAFRTAGAGDDLPMPNLGLSDREIAALTSYLNARPGGDLSSTGR
jgi:mono/diheme cytochrome c family protein